MMFSSGGAMRRLFVSGESKSIDFSSKICYIRSKGNIHSLNFTSETIMNKSSILKIIAALMAAALCILVPLRVLADTIGPTISSNFSMNWYNTSSASGTITASDLDNVAAFTCTGGTITNSSSLGGITATIDMTVSVAGDGTYTINCTARDEVGNSTDDSFTVNFDTTGPAITPNQPSSAWTQNDVTVTWNCRDDLSGFGDGSGGILYTTTIQKTVTTEGANQTVSAFCTDLAGNNSDTSAVTGINIDKTPPGITFAGQNPPANSAGWNNNPPVTLTWNCSDALSGSTSEVFTQTVSTDGTQSVIGTCVDIAGNTSNNTQTVEIDTQAPSNIRGLPDRTPDQNDWYNHVVNIKFTGDDGGSGINASSCTLITYNGPSGKNIVAGTGSCSDLAGNSASGTAQPINYDHIGPTFVINPARSADLNGWYNQPLSFSITGGSDNLSGFNSCTSFPDYSGPDGANVPIIGTCSDLAGNKTTQSLLINYDATAPGNIVGEPDRLPDKNGWYNTQVNIVFKATDTASGVAKDGCTKTVFHGPDSAAVSVQGTCTDKAGNQSKLVDSVPFKYDTHGPTVTWTPSSLENWYNTDVTINFAAVDELSGPDICTPDSVTLTDEGKGQSAISFCLDKAGNLSPVVRVPYSINIDKTPPIIAFFGRVPAPNADGWAAPPVTLAWKCEDALSGNKFDIVSQQIQEEGQGLSATGTCEDLAGNKASNMVDGINVKKLDASQAASASSPFTPTAEATQIIVVTQAAYSTSPDQNSESGTGSGSSTIFFILGGVVVAGLLIWLIFFLLKKKNG
jgi:hypothetical protein